MKKTVKILLILMIIMASLTAVSVCSAQAPALFQPVIPPAGSTSKIGLVNNLPKGDWTQIMASVINIVLAITGSLAFASFTFGGVMMVTAQGNDEQIRKGKNILFWSVLALVIIAASYAIVIGI